MPSGIGTLLRNVSNFYDHSRKVFSSRLAETYKEYTSGLNIRLADVMAKILHLISLTSKTNYDLRLLDIACGSLLLKTQRLQNTFVRLGPGPSQSTPWTSLMTSSPPKRPPDQDVASKYHKNRNSRTEQPGFLRLHALHLRRKLHLSRPLRFRDPGKRPRGQGA